jgi:hypothetical protein
MNGPFEETEAHAGRPSFAWKSLMRRMPMPPDNMFNQLRSRNRELGSSPEEGDCSATLAYKIVVKGVHRFHNNRLWRRTEGGKR